MKSIEAHGVIIKPDTLHRISGEGPIISILIDAESELCSEVISLLGSKAIVQLEPSVKDELIHYFEDYASHHFSEEGIRRLLSKTVASGKQMAIGGARPLDKRIANVVETIKISPHQSISFENLTETSGLSGSRFMHLFKNEIGTSIRKFVLWNKLQHAIKLHLMGNSLQKSASLSGFTDAAHFNRVFVSNYGINPSSLLK
ncbi:MAG: AraC family transcriptional regulator [Chryseolinea sp.]